MSRFFAPRENEIRTYQYEDKNRSRAVFIVSDVCWVDLVRGRQHRVVGDAWVDGATRLGSPDDLTVEELLMAHQDFLEQLRRVKR